MATLILTAAQAVGTLAYNVAAGAGASLATASTVGIYATTISAVGIKLAGAAILTGIAASAARPDLPDPEYGKIARRQGRPMRTIAVGGPSRIAGFYSGARQ